MVTRTKRQSRETIDHAKTLGDYLPDGLPEIPYPLSDSDVVGLLQAEFQVDKTFLTSLQITGRVSKPADGWGPEGLLAIIGTAHAFRRWNPAGKLFEQHATQYEKALAILTANGEFHRFADSFTAWSYRDLAWMLAKADPNSIEGQETWGCFLGKLHAEGKR